MNRIRAWVGGGSDKNLLGGAGHETSARVVNQAANEGAMPGDRHSFLRMEVPLVEPHRPVQPDGVVQARGGKGCVIDLVGMATRGHVEQQVVARVGEHRAVNCRPITDVSRQAHPVRARSGLLRASHEGGWLGDSHLQWGWDVEPGLRPVSHLGRDVLHPVLQ